MYKDGIDFVVISHCKADYVNLLVKSIRKFVSEIDYDIYIVNNFVDEKNELKELNDFFSDNDDIHIFKMISIIIYELFNLSQNSIYYTRLNRPFCCFSNFRRF